MCAVMKGFTTVAHWSFNKPGKNYPTVLFKLDINYPFRNFIKPLVKNQKKFRLTLLIHYNILCWIISNWHELRYIESQ